MKFTRLALALAVVFVIGGCGDDDPSFSGGAPTPVPAVPTPAAPATGPVITFLGVTRADDVLVNPVETSPDGVPIFMRAKSATGSGSGFRLVIEGKPGSSGSPVGLSTFEQGSGTLADLQIQANRPLGDGSAAVCDVAQRTPGPTPGGVPAINPPSFTVSTTNVDRINDLSCRFRDGIDATSGISDPIDGCVKTEPLEDYIFVDSATTVQFCAFVSTILSFPEGDTLLTVRLRDQAENVGEAKRMIIRVR